MKKNAGVVTHLNEVLHPLTVIEDTEAAATTAEKSRIEGIVTGSVTEEMRGRVKREMKRGEEAGTERRNEREGTQATADDK